MSISINAVIRKDKMNSSNCAPINIRFTLNRKNRYIGTNVTIPIDAWNAETQQINPNYPKAAELQLLITTKQKEYEKKIKRLDALEIEVNFDTLFGAKSKRINCTLQEFFTQTIDKLLLLGKHNTVSKYRSTLSLLKQYHKNTIKFEDIDFAFIRDFEMFLRQNGNNSNTIATRLSNLKAVYNKAVAEDVFVPEVNPFSKYKIGSLWTKTRKRAITKEDIQKLRKHNIPHNYRSNYKAFARDIFLFSYLTMGINFADIAHLKYKDIRDGRIYYSRRKTQKMLTCKLNPLAFEIIEKYTVTDICGDDYIFPILSRNVHLTAQQQVNRIHKALGKINDALGDLGEEIGLDIPLTTYVARHSYATVLKRAGVSTSIICESLGHSSERVTQIYLDSFENSQIDAAMQHLL